MSRESLVVRDSERFTCDFWLDPDVVLTPTTPLNFVKHFCRDHGVLLDNDSLDKRELLHLHLEASSWPEGLQAYLASKASGMLPQLSPPPSTSSSFRTTRRAMPISTEVGQLTHSAPIMRRRGDSPSAHETPIASLQPIAATPGQQRPGRMSDRDAHAVMEALRRELASKDERLQKAEADAKQLRERLAAADISVSASAEPGLCTDPTMEHAALEYDDSDEETEQAPAAANDSFKSVTSSTSGDDSFGRRSSDSSFRNSFNDKTAVRSSASALDSVSGIQNDTDDVMPHTSPVLSEQASSLLGGSDSMQAFGINQKTVQEHRLKRGSRRSTEEALPIFFESIHSVSAPQQRRLAVSGERALTMRAPVPPISGPPSTAPSPRSMGRRQLSSTLSAAAAADSQSSSSTPKSLRRPMTINRSQADTTSLQGRARSAERRSASKGPAAVSPALPSPVEAAIEAMPNVALERADLEEGLFSIGEDRDEGRCRQIDRLAKRFRIEVPKVGEWLHMLGEVLDRVPHAVLVVDMKVPGLPMAFCNTAMCTLTGYSKEELEGHNCRVLQGLKTEPEAVHEMVSTIRSARRKTVYVTNYRKDGSSFLNSLTMQPVRDPTGVFRFCFGVLCDEENEKRELRSLSTLLQVLPTASLEDSTTPRAKNNEAEVSMQKQIEQAEKWRPLLTKFARLLWSMDWVGSLRLLVTNSSGASLFHKWLTSSADRQLREDAMTFEFVELVSHLQKRPGYQYEPRAIKLCYRLLGTEYTKGEVALQKLCEHYERMHNVSTLSTMAQTAFPHLSNLREVEDSALAVLAVDAFPKFVQSKACLPLVETLLSIGDASSIKELIWNDYTVPSDTAGWIRSFVSVAEMFPACIVLSDMAMAGNPMFFVNREFCNVTGYSKDETHGRNCRFLQGPKTEPEAVAYIQDTLRRGVDCHVKITNYRKDGEQFQNLLSMRPVHDSNGVYRFCIGVQFAVTNESSKKERLGHLDQLLQMLPSTIEVAHNKAVGQVHHKLEAFEEKSTQLSTKLESALAGSPVAPKPDVTAYKGVVDYGQNHEVHLKSLGIALDRCEQVDRMARELGCTLPPAGPWLQMLIDVIDQIGLAMLVVDMNIPGLPMAFCNSAMASLTGYSKEELKGRNCRMLQGEKTEAASIAKMVDAIRSGEQTTLSVVNYKRDGSTFTNILTIHPVRDTTGVFKYCLGVLGDKKDQERDEDNRERLHEMLPVKFNAVLQAQRIKQKSEFSLEQQQKQWDSSLALFTRLLWSLDWEAALRQIVARSDCFPALTKWFAEKASEQVSLLELILVFAELSKSSEQESATKAIELARMYLDQHHSNGVDALAALNENVSIALSALAADSFPRFVRSQASLQVIKMLMGKESTNPSSLGGADDDESRSLVWSGYTVPPDVTGWVYSFVTVANTFAACIVISDMAMSGNPMIFVNEDFCKTTGYSREEALGRNCRFLQGPKTEPSSVATIQDTLRRGVDCITRITNYRKTGEKFENLLTMRPVHDSNGVYRYCIGVQFEVTDEASCKPQLDKLVKLVKQLPSTIEVSGPPVGPVHNRIETSEDAPSEIATRMEKALVSKARQIPETTVTRVEVDNYGRNHAIQMRRLGIRAERCDRVDDLARALNVAPPYAGPWLQMLCEVLDHVPNAVTVVNMQEPGLPMAYCNSSMAELTGYSKEQLEGKNCRILQGEETEAESVTKLVDAIRKALPTTVHITNYKADGSKFANVVTLNPIRDSTGVYRYCLGILCDRTREEEQGRALAKLRKALVDEFDATLPDAVTSIKASDERLPKEQHASQRRRWIRSLSPLTKMQWTLDCERSLRQLLKCKNDVNFLIKWLHQGGGQDQAYAIAQVMQIDECLNRRDGHKGETKASTAIDLCREVLSKLVVSEPAAVEFLTNTMNTKIAALVPTYQAFVDSWASNAFIEKQLISAEDDSGPLAELLWRDYALSPDVAGWVRWLAAVSEQFLVSVTISDMTLPSCPMIFVNSAFCHATGFSKDEAHGRSCRFLQGPQTEPASVAAIVDALRRGVDGHIQITNYHKGGSIFQNMLSLHPVHDSNGVYRFCIGVQFVINETPPSKEHLASLEQLLQLLPSTVEVASRPIGPVHLPSHTDEEASMTLTNKLENALGYSLTGSEQVASAVMGESSLVSTPSGVVPNLVDSFANHHHEVLKELGLESKATNKLYGAIAADPPAPIFQSLREDDRSKSRELREMVVASAADPQLQAMASSLGLRPPAGASWLEQLGVLADQMPHAMLIVDMTTPGVKIDFVNTAFEDLTLYSKDEAIGRNCKFMQGARTEPMAVRRIGRAIQREVQETLRVTNYRKDGSAFRNNLTLHPVHDVAGTYRYSIGVLSDAAQEEHESAALAKLRSSLPTMIDHLQSMLADETVMNSALNSTALQSPRSRAAKALARKKSAGPSTGIVRLDSFDGSMQTRSITGSIVERQLAKRRGSSKSSHRRRRLAIEPDSKDGGISPRGTRSIASSRSRESFSVKHSSGPSNHKESSDARSEGGFTRSSDPKSDAFFTRSSDVRSEASLTSGGGTSFKRRSSMTSDAGSEASSYTRGSERSSRNSKESDDESAADGTQITGTTTPPWPRLPGAPTSPAESGRSTPLGIRTPPATPRFLDGDGTPRSVELLSAQDLAMLRWDFVRDNRFDIVENEKGFDAMKVRQEGRALIGTLAQLPMVQKTPATPDQIA